MVKLKPVEYEVTITVKSPLAITTGESYYLTDYALKDGCLFVLDSNAFAEYLSRKGKLYTFINLLTSNVQNLEKVRTFIDETFDLGFESLKSNSLKIECDPKAWENLITGERKREIRKIFRNQFDAEKKPYIPGSTIKGAIRNALETKLLLNALKEIDKETLPFLFEELNKFLRERKKSEEILNRLEDMCVTIRELLQAEAKVECIKKTAEKSKKEIDDKKIIKIFDSLVERALQKDFRQKITEIFKKHSKKPPPTAKDLMRFIKVSDFQMEKGEVRIGHPENSKMGDDVKIFTEYVAPGAKFKGSITIYKGAENLFESLELNLTIELIVEALKTFASKTYSLERNKKLIPQNWKLKVPPDYKNSPNKSLLKLGFHAGALSKTVGEEHLRAILIRKKGRKVKYENYPSSTWLLNGKPMGWCLLEVRKRENAN
ncbi:CRISPR type III-A/MTUBE-associated RAMP protein Csm5 [Desulfurobacterium pacificum]|uniref:CRISPR system Cms protein Csm5 n=1 Tax=Desulfurobacterium pacificum TaxID=240166 RepID=A0ABY1NBH2_9BACT|nr:type III-A CRISPR-associated RAMP protein Csm5 [Desulfurobacterium pacificum]SMP05109.1 CRISPR type III-A/MTUBE-associated RAMP protein Csm5 [Desulfurobacterium pacificum]